MSLVSMRTEAIDVMDRLFGDEALNRLFRRGQLKVLVGTMIGYMLFYFLRKNLSFAMPGLAQDYGITKTGLGLFLCLVVNVLFGFGSVFAAMIAVAFLGAGLFALLWRSKSTGYETK